MFSFMQILTLFSLLSSLCFVALPAGYVRFSQEEKNQILWDNLASEPFDVLPSLSNRLLLQAVGAGAAVNLRPTIDTKSNEVLAGRIKFIHTHGSCAQVELITVDNPYTGLFSSSSIGIVRLDWAAPLRQN